MVRRAVSPTKMLKLTKIPAFFCVINQYLFKTFAVNVYHRNIECVLLSFFGAKCLTFNMRAMFLLDSLGLSVEHSIQLIFCKFTYFTYFEKLLISELNPVLNANIRSTPPSFTDSNIVYWEGDKIYVKRKETWERPRRWMNCCDEFY